jgi:hypothetical protein
MLDQEVYGFGTVFIKERRAEVFRKIPGPFFHSWAASLKVDGNEKLEGSG